MDTKTKFLGAMVDKAERRIRFSNGTDIRVTNGIAGQR
jgi:hypothetical protein